MMNAPLPLTRDLVFVGGGHAHALALRMWGMNPLPGARVTVIDPNPSAPYTGMLPGHVAGHYARDALEIDLVRLCRFAGARLVRGRATSIDAVAQTITVEGGVIEPREIAYDVASIDIGIHAKMPGIEGFSEHAIAVKPLGPYAAAWDEFLRRVESGERPAEATVIGGGIAGIEIAMAMAHALKARAGEARVNLIEAGPVIAANTPKARRRLEQKLRAQGVTVLTGARAVRIEADCVHLDDGTRIESAFTVGSAGARAYEWLADCDLPTSDDGFLRIGADLRVPGYETLFAAGDCAHFDPRPLAKAGVYAVREAPILFQNIRAVLSDRKTRPFKPQRDYLKLISLGGKSALAEKFGTVFSGPLLWRWKDQIDQKFMSQFKDFPQMSETRLPRLRASGGDADAQPLCGGCGSKVAPGTLADILGHQPALARPDVITGPGDDAAILEIGQRKQVLTTDHLRAFTSDYAVQARITALHALGDVWAMGAEPQAALASITLPRMSAPLQARTMAEIMDAAGAVLRDAGAELVGGHSTMGAEMSLGFTLTGLLEEKAISNAGARVGDALILTRPIGSGTILAGEMRGMATGRDVATLLDGLQRPQGDAAAILSGAHAMTDVTGFGLAGHLLAICRASNVGAEIGLTAIPLYEGAEALARSGVRSTIWQENRDAAPVEGAGDSARAALLHDPQTAGGFLASVDEGECAVLLEALKKAGHGAARIGRIVSGTSVIRAVQS